MLRLTVQHRKLWIVRDEPDWRYHEEPKTTDCTDEEHLEHIVTYTVRHKHTVLAGNVYTQPRVYDLLLYAFFSFNPYPTNVENRVSS